MYSMHRLTFDSQLRLVFKLTIFRRRDFLQPMMLIHKQLGSHNVFSPYWIHFAKPPPFTVSPKMCLHTAGLKADKVKGLVNL